MQVPLKTDATQPTFAFCKTSNSSTFHIEIDKAQASPSHSLSEKTSSGHNEQSRRPLRSISEIKENVYKAVACQKTLAKSIEVTICYITLYESSHSIMHL